MSKPFGIDVSRYQGVINWDVVVAHEDPKVEFVAIRAAISWGYVDPWFDKNWKETKRVNIPRGAYHVFYPTSDPIRQAKHFVDVVNAAGGLGELPLIADVELQHDATPAQYQSNLLKYLQKIEELADRKPMIYSRASFIDHYVSGSKPPTWYKNYDWWLAQYLISGVEHKGPPNLPINVPREKVKIHQTSDKGKPFGVQSGALDYNRWQFDLDDFKAYIKNNQSENPDYATLLKQYLALKSANTTLVADNEKFKNTLVEIQTITNKVV